MAKGNRRARMMSGHERKNATEGPNPTAGPSHEYRPYRYVSSKAFRARKTRVVLPPKMIAHLEAVDGQIGPKTSATILTLRKNGMHDDVAALRKYAAAVRKRRRKGRKGLENQRRALAGQYWHHRDVILKMKVKP